MTDSGFDDKDDVIGHRLRAAAQGSRTTLTGEGAADLDRLRGRFDASRARRRRQQLGGAAAVMVVVVGGAVLLRPSTSDVRVAEPGINSSTTTIKTSSSSTSSTSTSSTPAATPTTIVGPGPTTTPANAPTPSNPPQGQGGGSVVPPTTQAAPSGPRTTTSATGATRRQVYPSAGGSLTVDFSVSTGLVLVSNSATPGFTADVRHNEPDRIEVRFSSPEMESTIELRVVNGVVEPRVEDKPD